MNLHKLSLIVVIIEIILYFIIKIIVKDNIIRESIALGYIISNLILFFVIIPIIIFCRKLGEEE